MWNSKKGWGRSPRFWIFLCRNSGMGVSLGDLGFSFSSQVEVEVEVLCSFFVFFLSSLSSLHGAISNALLPPLSECECETYHWGNDLAFWLGLDALASWSAERLSGSDFGKRDDDTHEIWEFMLDRRNCSIISWVRLEENATNDVRNVVHYHPKSLYRR